MDEPHRVTRDELHQENVERTLKELQKKVAEQEELLKQLRKVSQYRPQSESEGVKATIDTLRAGYEAVTQAEPFLPFPDSVLPALATLRSTHRTTASSRAYMAAQEGSLERAARRLEAERASLDDQKALNASLEARLRSLREGKESRTERTPKQVAQEKTDELRRKARDYDQDTSKLMAGLNRFIDDRLGAMLAAEELGGPVVGGMVEVDPDVLEAGFSAQGRPRKAREKDPGQGQDKRQRRIDAIWGTAQDPTRGGGGRPEEAVAAGRELRELTEELLNTAMDSVGDNSAGYVQLARESAAARFLVRAKVAEFHPRDATRLRLIDFGREIDD